MTSNAKQMVEDDDIFKDFEPLNYEEAKFKPYKVEKMSDEEFEAQYNKLTERNFSDDFDWF